MTVKELIEHLQMLPQDAPVQIKKRNNFGDRDIDWKAIKKEDIESKYQSVYILSDD